MTPRFSYRVPGDSLLFEARLNDFFRSVSVRHFSASIIALDGRIRQFQGSNEIAQAIDCPNLRRYIPVADCADYEFYADFSDNTERKLNSFRSFVDT